MSLKAAIMQAARADAIPKGSDGLWYIQVCTYTKDMPAMRNKQFLMVRPGTYRYLYRLTDDTLYHMPPGELVMHDTDDELNTHLRFMLKASGRVLVTGLGLGCVARGLLANPAVTSVTVVERDPSVIKLVWPYMPAEERLAGRLRLVHAEALQWVENTKDEFDCAWHDLWSDPAKDEPHLQRTHMKLICALVKKVKMQGAWAFPREFRHLMQKHNVI